MKLSPHVFLFASGALGCALSHSADCNAYALRGASGRFWLFDSGCGQNSERLLEELENDDLCPTDCAAILLTHGHLDHAGGAAALAARTGAPIWAGTQTAAWLREGNEEAIGLAEAKRAGVYGAEFSWQSAPVARELHEGDCLRLDEWEVRVLETPGHSPDSLSFWVQKGEWSALFGGDLIFHGGKILASATNDCQPAAYAQSLRRVSQIEADALFPGHGLWVLSDAKRHLTAPLSFLDRMLLPSNLL